MSVRVPCTDYDLVLLIQKEMQSKYATYFVVFQFEDKVYARFSAQIYNDITDFQKVGLIFKTLLQEQQCFKP